MRISIYSKANRYSTSYIATIILRKSINIDDITLQLQAWDSFQWWERARWEHTIRFKEDRADELSLDCTAMPANVYRSIP